MALDFAQAAFSPLYILAMIGYAIYSIYKASKKKEQSRNKRTSKKTQPGKSIEDILRELEKRASGKETPPPTPKKKPQPIPAPAPAQIGMSASKKKKEKTVEEFKAESHSNMKEHHVTQTELNDGKFDDIDDRLMHLERNEIGAHSDNENSRYNLEDLRKAVILSAILNRPDY